MKNLKSIKNLVSHTPLVKITYSFENYTRHVYAKCEWFSLTGSIKDKVAYQIFCDAYESGNLKTGEPVVEVSSGNMGISICAMGNLLNNPVTIIMPKNMSEERKALIRQYGARLVETEDFASAFQLEQEYIAKGYFCTNQFENKSNIKVHKNITAKEILEKLSKEKFDAFVSGVGTGGTLCGVGKVLKEKRHARVVAIEPANARILSGEEPHKHHQIQGISDEIVPALYDSTFVDEILPITDEDAIAMSQKLCKELAMSVGISSGANFLGCVLSKLSAVTVFPDDNKKYLSTALSAPITTPLTEKIKLLSIKVL